jgi:hypothetical protein
MIKSLIRAFIRSIYPLLESLDMWITKQLIVEAYKSGSEKTKRKIEEFLTIDEESQKLVTILRKRRNRK